MNTNKKTLAAALMLVTIAMSMPASAEEPGAPVESCNLDVDVVCALDDPCGQYNICESLCSDTNQSDCIEVCDIGSQTQRCFTTTTSTTPSTSSSTADESCRTIGGQDVLCATAWGHVTKTNNANCQATPDVGEACYYESAQGGGFSASGEGVVFMSGVWASDACVIFGTPLSCVTGYHDIYTIEVEGDDDCHIVTTTIESVVFGQRTAQVTPDC